MKNIVEHKKIMLSTFKWTAFIWILCNLPPFTGILTGMLVDIKGTPFGFVSKDFHFYMTGDIRKVKTSKAYNTYINKFPTSDGQLFRFNKSKNYIHFWRYGEYILNPNWQADYLELPEYFSTERYYGSYIDENPLYEWDIEKKKWVKK